MQNVINLSDGAGGIINNLRVEDMRSIGRVLRTFGQGTQARLRSSTIDNNRRQSEPWWGIEAIDNSLVEIQGLNMTNNRNLEHHVAATFGASVSIVDMTVERSTGSRTVSIKSCDHRFCFCGT